MKIEWPRISIVTPSLNQGDFIEQTIQSILAQEYPNLDYIVVDGGSTDGTLSILNKFNGKIKWISERDSGQAEAINKGLRLATGEILTYVNADDILLSGSLALIANLFVANPNAKWLTGRCRIINENGKDVRSGIYIYKNCLLYSSSYHLLLLTNYISQPATFWRKGLLDHCGFFDTRLKYVMDYDYWLRLWKIIPPHILHQDIAGFRIHHKSKTTSGGHLQDYILEENQVVERHSPSKIWYQLHGLHRLFMTNVYRVMNR